MNSPLCTGFESPFGVSRRSALARFGGGLGSIALANLFGESNASTYSPRYLTGTPKAKRVIFLFQAGGPSQMDLFDYKPKLNEEQGKELPASVRMGQRLTGMSGNQASLPLVGSPFQFAQHGQSGTWLCDQLPHHAKIVDDITVINSMYTEAINHGPGVTFMQSGSQIAGRPSIGSWLSYGLGSTNENLPSFVVLVTKDKKGQPLVSRLWGSGFLPGKHDGVRFRPDKDAVLYLNNPNGVDSKSRRMMLDRLEELHQIQLAKTGDTALETRIAQYEMGFRMQTSIPDVTDLSSESDSTFELYGEDARTPGTFAANCLLARRLAEQGVQFIQLYHQGWDHHGGVPGGIKRQTKDTDQASAALVLDLKQRGLLDDTLVIWGGEFGRTNYCQGKFNQASFGRDHHPRCFSIWMAGGGVKGGYTHGQTDEYGYNVVEGGVHVHDFHATLLHLMGIDHELLTYQYQGRHFRLTDVHGHVVKEILA
ncbi:MAG: sulfatase [Verrucomicrobiales bacterium]|nr:sulfatase [Verrucomicrobiales bacterium]